jgi:hypothetical protein
MLLMDDDDLMGIVDNSGATYNFQYGLFEIDCKADFTVSVFVGPKELKGKYFLNKKSPKTTSNFSAKQTSHLEIG